MGLFGPAISAFRADMPAFFDYLFRAVRLWNFAQRISPALAVWRGKTTFSCPVDMRMILEIHLKFCPRVELTSEKCYNQGCNS